MGDFSDYLFKDGKCTNCGTDAIYELGKNYFACKCTYELESELTPDEIVATVKQVRKEMAEERAKGEQK